MIEIVAKAIDPGAFMPKATSAKRSTAMFNARAAINALREPSDKMLAAGVVHDDATYSTWIAMIDEALRDE